MGDQSCWTFVTVENNIELRCGTPFGQPCPFGVPYCNNHRRVEHGAVPKSQDSSDIHCGYTDANEPDRSCHRPPLHDGQCSEWPVRGERPRWELKRS